MIEYIQAGDGTAHVSSADDGALFSTIVGTECYVGKGLADGLPLTIKDNNHLVLGTGTGWHNGRGFRVISNEDVTIQSGTQGQRRIDLIVSRYVVDGSVERGSIAVIKGEPVQDGIEPSVPKHEEGNILEGVSISDFPLYAVKLNGLQIESTEKLFTTVPSLTDLMGLMEAVQQSVKAIEAKNASQDTAIAGKAASSHTHAAATQGANGFMSAADKKKLDGVAAGANAYSLPRANGGTVGGVTLSDSTTSGSNANGGVAATPAAVKAVRDLVAPLRNISTTEQLVGTFNGANLYRKLVVGNSSSGLISTGVSGAKLMWIESAFLIANDGVFIPMETWWSTSSYFNAIVRRPNIEVQTNAWYGQCYFVVLFTR